MSYFLGILILLLGFLFEPFQAQAFFWGKKYLVKINGQIYTKEDFKNWWENWKEKDTPFPDSPEPFIDWILLSDEAKALNLQDTPTYKRKLEVFLKVRSLLLLKAEEVDGKIKITREKLWAKYMREFVPRLKIKVLYSSKKPEIETWLSEIKSSGCEKIFEKLPAEQRRDLGWQRPRSIPEKFRSRIVKAEPGEVVGPLKDGKRFLLVCVLEKEGPTPGDFKRLIPTLSQIVRKEEEARLTKELVEKLKKKYKVEVNKEILDQIGLNPLPEKLKKAIVLRIEDRTLTAERFQEILRKDIKVRYPKKKEGDFSPTELQKAKEFILNNIISQTLTEIEALNRHYEERPPLKPVWEFYKRQMLVREFENRMIWPKVKVKEEEIRKYYEEHREDYLRPERVVIAVIRSEDEKLIREIYRRLRAGEDFFELAKEVHFHGIRPERYTLDQLVPEMREVLKGLEPGEVSGIVKIKTYYCIVKLIDRIPASPHPYEMVKKSIEKMLRQQKFEELRREILQQLKAKSRIEINWKAWRELREALVL